MTQWNKVDPETRGPQDGTLEVNVRPAATPLVNR
jgi:hypothetical protein